MQTKFLPVAYVYLSSYGIGHSASEHVGEGSFFCIGTGNATEKTIRWKSSDETVATVDSNGNVHAIAAGSAVTVSNCCYMDKRHMVTAEPYGFDVARIAQRAPPAAQE